MTWTNLLFVVILPAIAFVMDARRTKDEYREDPKSGVWSVVLFVLAMGAGVCFCAAEKFGLVEYKVYLWVGTLGLLWLMFLQEWRRHETVEEGEGSFWDQLRGKLTTLSGFMFAGGVLGLLLMYALQLLSTEQIGSMRALLVRSQSFLKACKMGSGAGILLLGVVVVAEWRLPSLKEKVERLWKYWKSAQTGVKYCLLVLTSLFCFSYTGTFEGGSLTPLREKVELAEKVYRDMVWQAEIDLSGELRIEAYQAAFESAPTSVKDAILAEVATSQQAAQIPAKYLPANFIGRQGELPRDFKSDGDGTLGNWRLELDQAPETGPVAVPGDAPMQGEDADESINEDDHFHQNKSVPEWLQGLPGELGDKIVDRALGTSNLKFIHEFSEEFPVIGALIETVDERLNSALTEKMKVAAGRMGHKRALGKPDHIDDEALALSGETKAIRESFDWQENMAKSRAIEKEVAVARVRSTADLRAAIEEELKSGARKEQGAVEDGADSGEERKPKTPQERERYVNEVMKEHGYEYLAKIRESPENAFRYRPEACCAVHETVIEREMPVFHPEPPIRIPIEP